MIEKVAFKYKLSEHDEIKQNREYWFSRPAAERIQAVDLLRMEFCGDTPGFQRVYRLVKQKRG
jgi:hypothetical protein